MLGKLTFLIMEVSKFEKSKTGFSQKPSKYVIGIDYGTDSVRALIVNANNGEEIASAVYFSCPFAK